MRFYAARIAFWRNKMGAGVSRAGASRKGYVPIASCPRYLAHVLQRQAYALRERYAGWYTANFVWQVWLPANWARLGACETGYGRRPGNWAWDSGAYVSAFGIYRAGYADDAHRIGNLSWDETKRKLGRLPTPREQYDAALSHYRTNGDGWGCPGP